MSLLWSTAMAWLNTDAGDEAGAVPVRRAGFRGYIAPTNWRDQDREIAEFNGRPDRLRREDLPTAADDRLHDFIGQHTHNDALWGSKGTLGRVDLSKGVYATQSHLNADHVRRFAQDPTAETWSASTKPPLAVRGREDEHPMFVTHQGRLHVIEGHHRVAGAIARGEKSIEGWHYDADRHGFPPAAEEVGVA